MNTKIKRLAAGVVVAVLTVFFSARVLAGPAPGPLLAQAYGSLAAADHDYKGHRAAAMKQIEEAGKLLGVNVRGDGKNHEPQRESDAHLRNAESLLQEARGDLSGKPLKHVEAALKDLSVALSIK